MNTSWNVQTFRNIALEIPEPKYGGGTTVGGWTLPEDIEEMLMDQLPRNIQNRVLHEYSTSFPNVIGADGHDIGL